MAPDAPTDRTTLRSRRSTRSTTAQIREFTTEPFFLTPLIDHLPCVEQRADAARGERLHRRCAGRAQLPRGCRPLHARGRGGISAGARIHDGRERGGSRDDPRRPSPTSRRSRGSTDYKDDARAPRRPAPDARSGSGRTDQPRQAHLLGDRGDPFARNGIARDADGARLPPRRGRVASSSARSATTSSFMITPVVEVDGRAKSGRPAHGAAQGPGGAVSHAAALLGQVRRARQQPRRHVPVAEAHAERHATFLDYNPTVFHDLHESASYLYTSTGRGPYNPNIDPILISEWNRLAYKEVKDMTAFGVPGVYTYDFYDGWAPNYMFWVANMRNSIGRFYETQGSRNGSTTAAERERRSGSGTGRTRRCRRSCGRSATTSTSSRVRCSSR
jgi:hypothetical protein